MARPLRIELAGGVYHVTSRGDRRETIFGGDLRLWGQVFHLLTSGPWMRAGCS